jgi:hypothetical protein
LINVENGLAQRQESIVGVNPGPQSQRTARST